MKQTDAKLFVIIILLGLSMATALLLESKMTTGYMMELVLILISIIFVTGILFGLWIEEPWAYPLSMLLFAASLANIVWLFVETKVFLTFAFGLLVNVAGLVMCIASLSQLEDLKSLETYEIEKKKRK